ncbi:hypothetical protein LA59_10750 [Vibrio harveyi]|nr:hypothetical protein LA59_10750 [Vibrio harveyi]
MFEVELELLKEIGVINTKVQKSQLNIRNQPLLHEAFASKHYEYIDDLKRVQEEYAFVLSSDLLQQLQTVLDNLENYSGLIKCYKSPNTTYEMGQYYVYQNFSDEHIEETESMMKQVDAFFQLLQKKVFNTAGRNEI